MNALLRQDLVPHAKNRPPLHEAHADVAMIAMSDFAALSRMSPSWIYEEIKRGRAPRPMNFGPRCARWRLADVRAWLAERAAQPQAESVALVTARAKKASAAAQVKRAAAAATVKSGGAA